MKMNLLIQQTALRQLIYSFTYTLTAGILCAITPQINLATHYTLKYTHSKSKLCPKAKSLSKLPTNNRISIDMRNHV